MKSAGSPKDGGAIASPQPERQAGVAAGKDGEGEGEGEDSDDLSLDHHRQGEGRTAPGIAPGHAQNAGRRQAGVPYVSSTCVQWLIIHGRFDGKAFAPFGAVTVVVLRDDEQQPQPAGCRWLV